MTNAAKYFRWILGSGFLFVGILSFFHFQTETASARPEVRQQLKILQKRQKEERRALSKAQAIEMKQWKIKERDARRLFFSENKQGEKRRSYIQDYIRRMEALEFTHKKQWTAIKTRHLQEIETLKESGQIPSASVPEPTRTL